MSRTILVTGSQGLLGSSLVLNKKFNIIFLPSTHNPKNKSTYNLDILNSSIVESFLYEHQPDVIINCAAYTNVDSGYKHKKECHDINVNGLKNLLKYSSINTKIVHISTDYVFDGSSSIYDESSITRPVNYYGKTKLEAENILKGSNKDYLIFRPNVLYNNKGENFFTFVYNSLINKNKIDVVVDQLSNPTYVPFFVNVILDSIIMDLSGVFHYGSSDIISRYDFAILIADFFNLDKHLIVPVKSEILNQCEERPRNTSLDCTKILKSLDIELFSIKDSFLHMMKKC